MQAPLVRVKPSGNLAHNNVAIEFRRGGGLTMKLHTLSHVFKAIAIATAIFAFALVAPSVSAASGMLWCGAGYGPTPDVEITSAIDDAEVSASSIGQFTCTLVGKPEVFPRHNEYHGDFYSASVTMSCS
jgi:hypothetical protein